MWKQITTYDQSLKTTEVTEQFFILIRFSVPLLSPTYLSPIIFTPNFGIQVTRQDENVFLLL